MARHEGTTGPERPDGSSYEEGAALGAEGVARAPPNRLRPPRPFGAHDCGSRRAVKSSRLIIVHGQGEGICCPLSPCLPLQDFTTAIIPTHSMEYNDVGTPNFLGDTKNVKTDEAQISIVWRLCHV